MKTFLHLIYHLLIHFPLMLLRHNILSNFPHFPNTRHFDNVLKFSKHYHSPNHSQKFVHHSVFSKQLSKKFLTIVIQVFSILLHRTNPTYITLSTILVILLLQFLSNPKTLKLLSNQFFTIGFSNLVHI